MNVFPSWLAQSSIFFSLILVNIPSVGRKMRLLLSDPNFEGRIKCTANRILVILSLILILTIAQIVVKMWGKPLAKDCQKAGVRKESVVAKGSSKKKKNRKSFLKSVEETLRFLVCNFIILKYLASHNQRFHNLFSDQTEFNLLKEGIALVSTEEKKTSLGSLRGQWPLFPLSLSSLENRLLRCKLKAKAPGNPSHSLEK